MKPTMSFIMQALGVVGMFGSLFFWGFGEMPLWFWVLFLVAGFVWLVVTLGALGEDCPPRGDDEEAQDSRPAVTAPEPGRPTAVEAEAPALTPQPSWRGLQSTPGADHGPALRPANDDAVAAGMPIGAAASTPTWAGELLHTGDRRQRFASRPTARPATRATTQ